MLNVSAIGAVAVGAGGAVQPVTLELLPEAINQTWHDSDDHTLPNCNLYSTACLNCDSTTR